MDVSWRVRPALDLFPWSDGSVDATSSLRTPEARGRCRTALVGAAGHRRQDDERVAVLDPGVEPVEHAHVLIVEVDVHVAVELAFAAEQLGLRRGVLARQR